MVRIAMLSQWHVHAGGYANFIKGNEKADVVAVWDDNKERGEAWAKAIARTTESDLLESICKVIN